MPRTEGGAPRFPATRAALSAHRGRRHRVGPGCHTADTEPCPEVEELAAGCRVLLAGASGLDADGPLRGHLTAGDAARLAARSGARLLVLTHLRAWQDPLALLDEAAAIAGCQVVLATPGLRIAL